MLASFTPSFMLPLFHFFLFSGNIYQPPRFLGDMGEPSDSGVEIVTDRYSASSIEQEATTEKKARHSTDN